MAIINGITERRSIRKFKTDDVSRDQIIEILEAGILAPSGNNSQPWRFIIVKDKDKREEIIKVDHNQKWLENAPVLIACIADITSRQAEGFDNLGDDSSDMDVKRIIRDTANCIENMIIQATAMGLGTCWTGWYDQQKMKETLGLDKQHYVVGVLAVGYADENPTKRPRKSLDELIIGDY